MTLFTKKNLYLRMHIKIVFDRRLIIIYNHQKQILSLFTQKLTEALNLENKLTKILVCQNIFERSIYFIHVGYNRL